MEDKNLTMEDLSED